MAKLLLLLTAAVGLLQITPGYRAQQLDAEGIRLMQQNRLAEAEAQFRQAVQADPANLEAVTNLGVAIFKQGRFAESIPFFEQAVASRPQKATLHNDLAQTYVSGWGALTMRRRKWPEARGTSSPRMPATVTLLQRTLVKIMPPMMPRLQR